MCVKRSFWGGGRMRKGGEVAAECAREREAERREEREGERGVPDFSAVSVSSTAITYLLLVRQVSRVFFSTKNK